MTDTTTAQILKNLTTKMTELRHLKSQPSLMGRWAHSFLQSCLGFNASMDYRTFYSDIGVNWRPTLLISRDGQPFCSMEIGNPPLKRHHSIPYGLLFTGTEWRLFDMQAPGGISLMAVCDLAPLIKGEISEKTIIELEKELAPFHEVAYQSKVWEALMEEARKCSTEFVTKILLSNDILQLMQQRLGVSPKEPACHKLLHYKLVDMLEDETPVKVSRTKNSSAA